MTTEFSAEPEVLIERRGASGFILLNRPKALNALTHGMVRAIHPQLEAWRNDPAVTRIVITGAARKPSARAATSGRSTIWARLAEPPNPAPSGARNTS